MAARILLVEDDPLSRDVLKGILQTRGHQVDAAGDGFAGLRMLTQGAYDLALVDYHLPELDGYASARLMRDAVRGDATPKLVAITADRHGLTARSSAETIFDAILSKPIEPQALFRFIDAMLDDSGEHASARAAAKALLGDPRRERARAAAEAFWRGRGLGGRPTAAAVPPPTREQALALSFCFDVGEPEAADLIVVLDPGGLAGLPALGQTSPAFPIPVVDVTGQALEGCDAAFRVNDPSSWSDVAAVLQRFKARRAHLAPAARGAGDLDRRLLAFLYVADRPLRIVHDPSRQGSIPLGGWFSEPDAMRAAERLSARGLLSRTVVDRPPSGLEFVYAMTEQGAAHLTGSGPGLQPREIAGPGPVQAALDRIRAEAPAMLGSVRRAAAGDGSANPGVGEAAAPPVARRRPETESRCEVGVPDGAPAPSGRAEAAASRPAADPGSELARSVRILLAESGDINREIARAMLEAAGHHVETVADGAAAVAAVREKFYGLVLMAVQMPGMDGVTATRRIRSLPAPIRGVPIVGLTASALPDQIAALREAGMNDHVPKPFRRDDLCAAIDRWRRPEPQESGTEPDVSPENLGLDRTVYDGLFDLVGREKALSLLDQLAGQLADRFQGEPVSGDDRARFARDAHAMISAAGVLGFSALSGTCQALEAAFAAGEDFDGALEEVRTAQARTLKAIPALKQAA